MDVVTGYVELGLRLGRHVDGLVDAYYGPPEISEPVAGEPLRDPAVLVADADALLAALADDGLEKRRALWLRSQLVGLQTVARKLAGEDIPYSDEVERCYGVRPRRVPEDEFEAAHRALDELLPGTGPLAERYQAWREGDGLEGDALTAVVNALAVDLRTRTAALVGLPDGEQADFDFVEDEPWSAYNYYLGNLRSRIAVNTDLPMSPTFVTELLAHEAYPGHHTEHAWKEHLLLAERGYLEASILMVGTPESLISEGVAQLAPNVLLGDELDLVTASHLARVGVPYDAESARRIREARRPLERVTANAALLLHEDGSSPDKAREYIRRWGLMSERRAAKSVEFLTDPVWRSYVSTYTDGERVCGSWVAGDPARFRRLLTEQLSPADLVGES